MAIGVDIVYIPEFEKRLKNAEISSIFSPLELSQNTSVESLAGVFAAKEAFFKAIGEKQNWLEVEIEKDKKGKPMLLSSLLDPKDKTSLSISHAGEYTIATVLFL